ncbi:MAG: desulfoferrodoxin Dfx [Coriobacteriales bacterium]|nr:desulfoferrodoxin Dfx [Coriobacteriales bacterium]
MDITFYICKKCGNIAVKAHDSGCALSCCGEEMSILEPNTTDAAQEKHVPVIKHQNEDVVVQVGSAMHPMVDDHYIEFIAAVYGDRVEVAKLKPGIDPAAEFTLVGDAPVKAYEYCNKHGLWSSAE